jgi:hypothetical protein
LFSLVIPAGGGAALQGAPAAGTVIQAVPGDVLIATVTTGATDPSITDLTTAILWTF